MSLEDQYKEQASHAGLPNTNGLFGNPKADRPVLAEPFVTAPAVQHIATHVGAVSGLQASRQLAGSPADAPLPVVKKAHEA